MRLFRSLFCFVLLKAFHPTMQFQMGSVPRQNLVRRSGRMPVADGGDTELVKGLLIKLIELDDVSEAPGVLFPHFGALLSANVSHASEELEKELTDAGLMTDEGPASIAGATDYMLSFLEEVTSSATSMLERHQKLLRDIVLAAQDDDSGLTSVQQVLSQNRELLDSLFLSFLRDEVSRVSETNKVLCDLIRSVEELVRGELENLTAEDANAFAQLLGTKDEGSMKDEVKALVSARDLYGRRRLWGTVQAVKAEAEGISSRDHDNVLLLASIMEAELLQLLNSED